MDIWDCLVEKTEYGEYVLDINSFEPKGLDDFGGLIDTIRDTFRVIRKTSEDNRYDLRLEGKFNAYEKSKLEEFFKYHNTNGPLLSPYISKFIEDHSFKIS